MSVRRFAPLNSKMTEAAKAEDATISGDWTFTQPVTIDCTSGEKLVLRDNTDGVTASNFIRWEQDDETSQGYIGFGSSGDDDLTLSNEKSGGDIQTLVLTGNSFVTKTANSPEWAIKFSRGTNVTGGFYHDTTAQYWLNSTGNTFIKNKLATKTAEFAGDVLINTGGYLSVQGGASDQGQVGQIAFVDIAGGVGRFGSYNWDTAAYQPVQVVGSIAEVASSTGDVTLDSADDIWAECGATGGLIVSGSSYKTNPTALRLGQYTSTIGYIQVPGNGQIDIWTGGTAAIARFAETSKKTTLFGNLFIDQGNGEAVTIKGGSTGAAMNSWIQWDESDNSRAGFIGYGSSGNTQLFLWNDIGDLFLQAGTGNPGQFKIFEDVLVSDDATATWSSPSTTAHGIWIVKNSWDDSGDGMFAHTAQSVTSWAGGSNFQLGDNGTNPNIDGDINAYMSNSYTLSVKNRTGGTRRIVVFYFGGG